MDVLMVTAELAPFVRSTEAADSVASLAKALRLLGHDVTIALPRDPELEEHGLLLARRLTPLTLASGAEVTVLDGQLASGASLVAFDAPGLTRRGAYTEDSAADVRRYALLAFAVQALAHTRAGLGQPFDVVHAHDWPGALIAQLFSDPTGTLPPCLLQVHDGARSAQLTPALLSELAIGALPAVARSGDGFDALAVGVSAAPAVTAASAAYVEHLQSGAFGVVGDAVRAADPAVVGVLGGVDYALFNPATDVHLASRYDAEDASNKGRSRSSVARELGLEVEDDAPLAFVPMTAASEALLIAVVPELLRAGGSFALAGVPSSARLEALIARHPGRLAHRASPSEELMHRLNAAADVALIADAGAPHARAVLVAQRYGAIPVLCAAEGLRDFVIDADAALRTGTGFMFEDRTEAALLGAYQRAVAAFRTPAWTRLRRRTMALDLGWERAARRYQQLYRQLCS